MESSTSISVTVYDKHLRFAGVVARPLYVDVTERWLGQGSGEIEVAADDPILEHLLEPGARVVVRYNPFADNSNYDNSLHSQILSGPVRGRSGSFLASGQVRVQVQDDWRLLRNSLAYVVPNGNVKATSLTDRAQTVSDGTGSEVAGTIIGKLGRFAWPTSPTVYPAETAVRLMLTQIQQQLARAGYWDAAFNRPYKLDVSPGGGLGADVRDILPSVRFQKIEDIVVPLLEAGGLGLKFRLSDRAPAEGPSAKGFLYPEFLVPEAWPAVLTPDSGVIRSGTWSQQPPTVLSVIVGGPGEEAARAFRHVAETAGYAEEWGDFIEVFKDATGAPLYWPPEVTDDADKVAMYYHLMSEIPADRKGEFESFLMRSAAKAIAEGAPTSGVEVQLQETEAFRYLGDMRAPWLPGFATGDLLTVAPSAEAALEGLSFTERITETRFTMTAREGVTVTPTLGSRSDDPDVQLAESVARLAAVLRDRSTNQ